MMTFLKKPLEEQLYKKKNRRKNLEGKLQSNLNRTAVM
jgi:hypothetical protein